MQSIVQQRGRVPFPSHTGERIYMREFRKSTGLPSDLARWQPTVNAMLDGIDADGPIYLMVDQGMVLAGQTHRRPGVHIDGYWVPALNAHRGGGHVAAAGWETGPRWITDGTATHCPPEAIILAADVTACRALDGEFYGTPGDGGDCSHIDVSGMREIILEPGIAYAGNVTMLHESIPVVSPCLRTVVRLNVPGWSPL